MNVSEQFERHFHPDQFNGSEPQPDHDLAYELEEEWQMSCGSPMWDELKAQEADSGVAS